MALLQLLASISQNRLPYNIPAIDSNDILYSSEQDYQDEVAVLSTSVFSNAIKCVLGSDAEAVMKGGKLEEKKQLSYSILYVISTISCLYELKKDEMIAVEQLFAQAVSVLGDKDKIVKRTKKIAKKYLLA